ncbi:hypothetical protein R3I94_006076 [Phoxinus phoxinus]
MRKQTELRSSILTRSNQSEQEQPRILLWIC